jgi:hypothetical protein
MKNLFIVVTFIIFLTSCSDASIKFDDTRLTKVETLQGVTYYKVDSLEEALDSLPFKIYLPTGDQLSSSSYKVTHLMSYREITGNDDVLIELMAFLSKEDKSFFVLKASNYEPPIGFEEENDKIKPVALDGNVKAKLNNTNSEVSIIKWHIKGVFYSLSLHTKDNDQRKLIELANSINSQISK